MYREEEEEADIYGGEEAPASSRMAQNGVAH